MSKQDRKSIERGKQAAAEFYEQNSALVQFFAQKLIAGEEAGNGFFVPQRTIELLFTISFAAGHQLDEIGLASLKNARRKELPGIRFTEYQHELGLIGKVLLEDIPPAKLDAAHESYVIFTANLLELARGADFIHYANQVKPHAIELASIEEPAGELEKSLRRRIHTQVPQADGFFASLLGGQTLSGLRLV